MFTSIKPDAKCTVSVKNIPYTIPYIVQGLCMNFDTYWNLWCSQFGLLVDFRELDIVDGGHLEEILTEAYKNYKTILEPGNCEWLDTYFP